jgi:hypothetical protein
MRRGLPQPEDVAIAQVEVIQRNKNRLANNLSDVTRSCGHSGSCSCPPLAAKPGKQQRQQPAWSSQIKNRDGVRLMCQMMKQQKNVQNKRAGCSTMSDVFFGSQTYKWDMPDLTFTIKLPPLLLLFLCIANADIQSCRTKHGRHICNQQCCKSAQQSCVLTANALAAACAAKLHRFEMRARCVVQCSIEQWDASKPERACAAAMLAALAGMHLTPLALTNTDWILS